MPSVPMLNRPQVAPNVRRAIDVPVASTGAGAAAMGLSVAADAFQKERERAGQIRANAAEAEIRQVSSRLATEVERMQRTQALGAEDFVAEKWGTEVSRITAGISDPAVRQAVEARASILRDELQGRARTHASRETERVRVESFKANQASDLETLVATPDAAPRVLGSIEQRTRDNALAEGKSKEVVDFEVAQAVSAAQYARVVGLVQNNRTEEAAKLLEQDDFRASLQAKELQDAQRLVKVESMAVRSQEATDQLVRDYPSEAAAVAAARKEYSGEMEDEVVRRVRDRFQDRRRTLVETRERLSDLAINAMGDTGDIDAIPADLRRTLEINHRTTWNNIKQYSARLRSGTAIVSEPEYQDRARNLTDEQLRDTDLTEFRPFLDLRDYTDLQNRQAKVRGIGGTGQNAPMSPLQIGSDLFAMANQRNLFRSRPTNLAAIQKHAGDRALYGQMRQAFFEELRREEEAKGRPLVRAEVTALMTRMTDDLVLEGGNWSNRVVPRAIAPEGAKELSPDERARRGLPSVRPGQAKGDAMNSRYLELTRSGMSPDEAIRQVQREMP
jgi:hypothetical protein